MNDYGVKLTVDLLLVFYLRVYKFTLWEFRVKCCMLLNYLARLVFSGILLGITSVNVVLRL